MDKENKKSHPLYLEPSLWGEVQRQAHLGFYKSANEYIRRLILKELSKSNLAKE
jgi:hypothetical protein